MIHFNKIFKNARKLPLFNTTTTPTQSDIDVEAGCLDPFENNSNSTQVSNLVFTISAVVDEQELDKRRKTKGGKVDSSHYVPTLYWNELSPAWSTDSIESKFEDERSKGADLDTRWASPAVSATTGQHDPVVNKVNDDKAGQISEFTATPIASKRNPHLKDWKPSKHIHNYFGMMYVFGTGHNHSRNIKYSGYEHRKILLLDYMRKGLRFIVVSGATFDSTCRAKNCLILFMEGERFTRFVYFAFHLTTLYTSIHGTYLLCQKDEITNMFKAIHIYEKDEKYITRVPYMAQAFALSTAFMALLFPLFYYGIWEESITDLIYYNSFGLSVDIFFWDWKNLNSTSVQLYQQHAAHTASNFAMGTVKVLQTFFSNLLTGMIWDLMTTSITAFYCWRHAFIENEVSKVVENVEDLDSEESMRLQERREALFQKWRKFGPVDTAINKVLSPIVPAFHFRNILMYAFLLSICILPDESSQAVVYILYTYNLVKSEITYIIGSRIAQQNETIRKWLRNWGMHSGSFTVNGRAYNLQAILDELDTEPVVFGRGIFAIDQRFHFGMLGLVCSLFVSLVNGIGKVNV